MTKILIEIDPELQRVVPVDPTSEMFAAANKIDDEMYCGGSQHGADVEQIWYAMLAAAPQPEPVNVEPVAWLSRESESGRICLDVEDKGESGTWSPSFPVYELPPTAGQTEQETAEACAKVIDQEACGGSAFNSASEYMAKKIRSGAWKEYKK